MWIRSRCLPSSNNAIRGPWRNDEREMGKSTPATGMMKKREKSDFLKWIRYVSWAKKQKHNLFRHIYSVKRRNHTPIFLRYGTVLPLPLFQLTGKKQKQPNNSGKLVENSMTVSGLCFFRPLFEFIFFLFCFTFINKMAKKKRCLDDDDDGSFSCWVSLFIFLNFLREIQIFLLIMCGTFSLKMRFIACLIAIESPSVSSSSS